MNDNLDMNVDQPWQSVNNVCDESNQTTPSARRRSRKSWFETPPATKLDIAFDKKKRRSSGAGKRKSVENMETLLLTHFTNPPKITFGKIKLGKTRTRHLLVKNPHDYEQDVVIEKFPFKKNFRLETQSFKVPADDCVVLAFSWTPEEDGNVREMVLFRVDDTYRLQAFLLGCAESPKPLKKQKKGLLAAKVKRPFSILHTPGLACIRDNYSPQEAEKQLFVLERYNVLQENANIQNQQKENTRSRRQVEAFPPPTLESTAIAKDVTSSVWHSKVYSNMADIGCSPTLPVTEFSPIPNNGGEIAHLVDSCCSIMHASPLRDVVVNKGNCVDKIDVATLELNGTNIMVSALDRKERKDLEERETIQEEHKPLIPKSDNGRNSGPVETKKEFLSPDSFLNDSLSVNNVDMKQFIDTGKREVVRKPRKSWTPHRKSPLRLSDPDHSQKKFLSPDSFLNDSIVARQSGIGATPGTPFTETAQAFNHDEFEKSIVSPNSFLEELNSTRSDSVNEPLFSCTASPAVVPDADSHNLFMKQLRTSTVETACYNKNTKVTCHMSRAKKTQSVNFSVTNQNMKTETIHQSKQSTLYAPTVASSRRATFVRKKVGQTADKFSTIPDALSPRRATFLVSKKNSGGMKISPKVQPEFTRGQKKMTRSQRYTNIHQAEVVEMRKIKTRRRSKGKGETVMKKSKKTRTQAFTVGVDTDAVDVDSNVVEKEKEKQRIIFDNEYSASTLTKEKPFMVVADEERMSVGKELFVNVDKDSSATITKDKPFMEMSLEDRGGSGKCLFSEAPEQEASETVTKDEPCGEEWTLSGKQSIETYIDGVQNIESVDGKMKTDGEECQKESETLPGLENVEFGSPSKMLNDVIVGDAHVGRMSMTVTKDRPSLSTIQESVSRDLSKSSIFADTPKTYSQTSISDICGRDSLNNKRRQFSGKKLFGADPLSPSKSPILSSIFRDIGSPSRLPSSPDVEVTRRITLTVTKSRPSDALKEATKAAAAEKETIGNTEGDAYIVAAKEETYVTVSESTEGYCRRKKVLGSSPTNGSANYNFKKLDTYEKTINAGEMNTLLEQTSTWEVTESPKGNCQSSSYTFTSPMFNITPHAIPNSPSSEQSRRSTHVIAKPKVLDLTANPRRLFPPLDGDEQDCLVMGKLEHNGERQSSVTSASSVYSTDSLEAKGSVSDISSDTQSKSPLEKTEKSESKQTTKVTSSNENLNMSESVFEKKEDIQPEAELVAPSNVIQETVLKPKVPEGKESMVLLKGSTEVDIETKNHKNKKRLRVSKVSPVSNNTDVPPVEKPYVETKNDNKWFVSMDIAERDKCVKIEVKCSEKKPVLSRLVPHSMKKRSLTDDKENIEKENVAKKRSKSDPSENSRQKKQGFIARLTSTGKKSKPATKGLAQSKLILVKKGKQGMPKHPLPFAAKNMYYDERWIEKQDRGFVHWLNFVLTPPDEYNYTASKSKVDAGSLNIDVSKFQSRLAPTKEVLSIRAYTARRRLNRLRRAACHLYQSDQIVTVIHKLEYEVEKKRISVRRDRMLHADIGIKQKILDMLLCYNPLWLRMGLETVFGEVLPLLTNSDVIGLSRYILYRFLGNPDIAQEYAHPTVPHLYRDGYAEAIAKHVLKKFLLLVYFLDQSKIARLIEHDPCLFCKDADIKASKDMLIQFSRDYLSGEGDVTKHLAYMGYTVSHTQTALDEFDYAVTRLGVDLRDGLRLTRVLELLTGEWNLVKCLRAPAISRLQKVHNIEMVFKALVDRGLDIGKIDGGKVTARDIVDGHREKTLKLLWHLIFHFQVDVLVNIEQLHEEVSLLEQSLRVKINMQKLLKIKQQENFARRDSGGLMSQDNERLELLLKWCRVVCLHYGVKIENFTVSFSDGRALCCLVHHYHPALLPLGEIHFQTSQSYQQQLEDREEEEGTLDLSQDWSFQHGTGLDSPDYCEEVLANERENFKTLYEKVSELGGIPLMLKSVDMSNTIPDEKVVVTYVSYLCGRLLDIRQESRAARVIQIAWKRYKLRTALREQHHEIKAAKIIQTRVRGFLQQKREQRQARSALVIQSAWRGHRARTQAEILIKARDNAHVTSAVIKIQALLQGFMVRTKYQRLRKATVTLQAQVRGQLVRRCMSRQQAAAKIIQGHYRNNALARRQRMEYLKQRSAALTLQRAYRTAVARSNFKKSAAASVVQAAWRMYKCRKQFISLCRSVVGLQSGIRMKQARGKYLQLKQLTITLQRRVRANKKTLEARQEFLVKKTAATTLQSQFRGLQQRREYARTIKAVTCIQKRFRGHKYRVKFQAMRLAATMIQRAYRLHKLAVQERESLRNQISACVTIQQWWKLLKHQKVEKQNYAATIIQTAYRCYLEKKQYRHSLGAVVVIQKTIRMVLTRRQFLRIKAAVIVLQYYIRLHLNKRQIQAHIQSKKHAIVLLQSCWRRIRAQRQYKKNKHAAVALQKNIRMFLAQTHYKKQLIAVRCLQQHARCYLERKKHQAELAKQTLSAEKIQAFLRMCQTRRQYKKSKHAAVILQKNIRMMLAQSQYRKQLLALKCLQQHARCYLERRKQLAELRKQVSAAVKIQSWLRMSQAQKNYLTVRQKLIILQSHIRCWKQRQIFLNQKAAAMVIQSRFRAARAGQQDRAKYQVMIGAAMTIQSAWRAYVIRQYYIAVVRATVKIQSWVRQQQAVRRYQALRKSCLMLQRHYRTRSIVTNARQEFLNTRSAVIKVQSAVRMVVCLRKYLKKKQASVTIQKYVRMNQQRVRYRQMLCLVKMETAALILQKTWRMVRERRSFRSMKEASIYLQQLYRARELAKKSQRRFLIMKRAAITIQAIWRGCLVRHYLKQVHQSATVIQAQYRTHRLSTQYRTLRNTVVSLQQMYRRKRECITQRCQFIQQKQAAAVLQKTVRMLIERRKYLLLRHSAITIQRAYHCHRERVSFVKLRRATAVCQQKYRASVIARQQRDKYCQIVMSTIKLQAALRGFKVRKRMKYIRNVIQIQSVVRGYLARRIYQRTLSSIVLLQTSIRRHLQEQKYHRIREATKIIQQKWQATLLAKSVRKLYLIQLGAAITIQQGYRSYRVRENFLHTRKRTILAQACVRGFLAKKDYRRKKRAASIIQNRCRAWYRAKIERKKFQQLRSSVCVLQAACRRWKNRRTLAQISAAKKIQSVIRMYLIRRSYRSTVHKVVTVQAVVRGFMARRAVSCKLQAISVLQRNIRIFLFFSKLQVLGERRRHAASVLQKAYRKHRLHVKKLQEERQAHLELYAKRAQLHLAAVRIQAWYRRCVFMRHARLRLASVIIIQRRVRVFLERLNYLKLKESTVLLQRQCRQWLELRHKSALIIQTAIKHWLYRQRQQKLHQQVAKIQAVWRGYRARKSIKCKKINRARARCQEATSKATEEKRLGNRTTSALDYLLQYKSLSLILEALMHLDVATRLSPRCCERLVEVHAVHVIYRLIRSCNRSIPHMELIKYSINILLNLAKYEKTVDSVHDIESTEILVDLLMIYREKGSAIFAKTCSLLGILALEPHRRRDILQQKRVVEKIQSIHSLVSRRNKVQERQNMVRAKLAASKSFNSTLPLPTPVKRRRIRPEWALKRDSLNALQEPLPAINFVLENLHLTAK